MTSWVEGLPANNVAGRARQAALLAWNANTATATSLLEYRSSGRVLLLGVDARVIELRSQLQLNKQLSVTAVVPTGALPKPVADDTWQAEVVAVTGYLGAFAVDVAVWREGKLQRVALADAVLPQQAAQFDIVLDLHEQPWIPAELPPPGYFHAPDPAAVAVALEQIPQLVGEFQKPKYFNYDPDRCAHSARGIKGCEACISACPTDAIISIGERIEVNPHLCQGGGSCATACPSGAIRYAYPGAADLLTGLRKALAVYREQSPDTSPIVLFHDLEQGAQLLLGQAADWPEHVLPIPVEELGSVGLEVWLTAIAYGADGVYLLSHPEVPASVRSTVSAQLEIAQAIMEGLAYDPQMIGLITGPQQATDRDMPERARAAAQYAAPSEKRTTLRLAIDHLVKQSPNSAPVIKLPPGAPFGEVIVDAETCTLCMSCVAVCPAAALADGGDRPALAFIEANCVQCGLCEKACPEQAITRSQRLLTDIEARRARRILNQEQAFNCVRCGKPFATQKIIDTMRRKLADHWMFANDAQAIRRLEMCEDCRVGDLFTSGNDAGALQRN